MGMQRKWTTQLSTVLKVEEEPAAELLYYADWELKHCVQEDLSTKKPWETSYKSGDEC